MAKLHVVKKLRNERDVLEVNKEELAEVSGANKSPKRYEAEDIEHLSDAFLSNLKAGDEVIKKTGEQKHSYVVSFKKDDEGMCLTYTDASVVETISYDLVDGHWVFNSKDVTPIGDMTSGDFSGKDLKAKTLEQSQANWTMDLELVNDFGSGTVLTNIYNRFEIINGMLYLIVNFSVNNPTENNVNSYSSAHINSLSIPHEIAEKLVDIKGVKASEVGANDTTIAIHECLHNSRAEIGVSISGQLNYISLCNDTGVDKVRITIGGQNITINAGATEYFSARLFLSIL